MATAPEVILAFDYGAKRIGVAVGQTTTATASPAGVIAVRGEPDWAAVNRCIRESSPTRLLVGVPYNMDGTETVLTATCRAFAAELARRFGLPVDCVDERLTRTSNPNKSTKSWGYPVNGAMLCSSTKPVLKVLTKVPPFWT